MKITIELESSTCAKITCDDREFTFRYRINGWILEGWREPTEAGFSEPEETIGGIVLCRLTEHFDDILQGYMLPDDNPNTGECYTTWERLGEGDADNVYDRVNGF